MWMLIQSSLFPPVPKAPFLDSASFPAKSHGKKEAGKWRFKQRYYVQSFLSFIALLYSLTTQY